MNKDLQIILRLSDSIQSLISDLHVKDPQNETFDQEGFLNGSAIIKDYLAEGEYGIAVEHLIYMVYESELVFPSEIIKELHAIASKLSVKNPYLTKVAN